MRILIVEDEKHIARSIAEVLKKDSYAVDLAHDGEYGLDCALSAIYDVIVLDIMLPKMDGLCVLKEIRGANISTPVILLTAKGEMEDRVRGLDLGADDYLAKPFYTEELSARIRAMARRKPELRQGGMFTFEDNNSSSGGNAFIFVRKTIETASFSMDSNTIFSMSVIYKTFFP